MRLDKILDILYGNLLNTTCISSFDSLSFDYKNVKNGTLFFALDNNEIEKAIENGAYGVVFSGDIEISDSEIAWIKVDDLDVAAFRLLRYLILNGEYTFLMFSPLELSLAKTMNVTRNKKPLAIMQGQKIYGLLEYLFNQDSNNEIILSDIKELEKIETMKLCSILYMRSMEARNYDFTNDKFIKVIPESNILNMKILSFSIFETKIFIESKYTCGLNLPYIFLPFLQQSISLFEYYNSKFCNNKDSISYNINNFSSNIFDITFIDSKGKFTSKEKSKAIIFCPNPKIFSHTHITEKDFQNIESIDKKITKILTDMESKDSNLVISYLKIYAKHLPILACYKKGFNIKKFSQKCVCMPFHNLSYLSQILSKMPYSLALVYGASKNDFYKSVMILKEDSKNIESKIEKPQNSLFS